jgi:hypothetical protein
MQNVFANNLVAAKWQQDPINWQEPPVFLPEKIVVTAAARESV